MANLKTAALAALTVVVSSVGGCMATLLTVMPNDASIDEGWIYVWIGLAAGALLGGAGFWFMRRRAQH